MTKSKRPIISVVKLSLVGCSPAEPTSVSFDTTKIKKGKSSQKSKKKNSLNFVHFNTSSQKQPEFCPLLPFCSKFNQINLIIMRSVGANMRLGTKVSKKKSN